MILSAILYLVLESIILLRIIVKIPLIETNFQTKTLKVRQIFLLYNGLIPFWRSILMFMVSRCLFNICSNLFDICRMFQKHLLKCMFLKKKEMLLQKGVHIRIIKTLIPPHYIVCCAYVGLLLESSRNTGLTKKKRSTSFFFIE